jgi:hypothetical protein
VKLGELSMEVKEMPDSYELEERLTKVEVKVNRLKNTVSELSKRIIELEQEEGEIIEEYLRQDEMLVRCRSSEKKGGKCNDEITFELACSILLACEDAAAAGEDRQGTLFTMEDLEKSKRLKKTGEKRSKFDIGLSWLKSLGMVEDVDSGGRYQISYEEVTHPQGLLRGHFEELPI